MRFAIGTCSSLAIVAAICATGAQAQDCNQYAADAIAQTREYQSLGCSGGLPEWWSLDTAHHRNWCDSLPAGSSEPAQGMASREAVLQQCRAAYRPPQVQLPPVQPPTQVRRPAVFEGTVCDHWNVLLQYQETEYRSIWQRGNGFFYTARWYGGPTVIDRIIYPLNANLSFWSEDSGVIFYYYNQRTLDDLVGEIGGMWEAEASDGEIIDDGVWVGECLDN